MNAYFHKLRYHEHGSRVEPTTNADAMSLAVADSNSSLMRT